MIFLTSKLFLSFDCCVCPHVYSIWHFFGSSPQDSIFLEINQRLYLFESRSNGHGNPYSHVFVPSFDYSVLRCKFTVNVLASDLEMKFCRMNLVIKNLPVWVQNRIIRTSFHTFLGKKVHFISCSFLKEDWKKLLGSLD